MMALSILVFCFGLLIGSFLNVVIYRIPKDLSVVKPRSACPSCGKTIAWYYNLPVLSWIFLKGKCAYCGTKIAWRYPLIELTVGFFAYYLFPDNLEPYALFEFVFYFSVACVFLAHFIIDLEHHLLPDKINLYLLLITIPYVAFTAPPIYWILGGAIGFLGPLAVTWAFYKLRGQIGLGGGDIKLFGILGLILGPVGIMHNIFMSCFAGAIIGVSVILIKKGDKNTPLAFGPYIILTASLQIFFPEFFKMINPF
jgi:prepilin signal peptidase PulO-like enzyme (type II secretory pathway)